jgi:hypothetical protein
MDALRAIGLGKSKTINVNVLLTTAIIWYAQRYGLDMTPEDAVMVTGLLYGAVNFVLRLVTNKPLSEKGAATQGPRTLNSFLAEAEAYPGDLYKVLEALRKSSRWGDKK